MPNTGDQRTQVQIKHIAHKIFELEQSDYSPREIREKLSISKYQYIRYRKTRYFPRVQDHLFIDKSVHIKPIGKINKNLNPVEFCDKYLAGKLLPVQRTIIKAFYNLPLDEWEKKWLLKMSRDGKTTWEEGGSYQELVLLIGMKAGKTVLASFIAQIEEYELFKIGDICKHYNFVPGQRIYIKNVATNADQAEKTIFAQIKSSIERSSYFKARDPKLTGNTYHFRDTNVFIESGHSNSSSLVGDACKLVSFDELDRFKTTSGKYSSDEVYEALVKSTDCFGKEGKRVSISSLVNAKGFMVHLYEQAKIIKSMLGFWMAEWEMQPERYSGKSFYHGRLPIPIEHQDSYRKNPEKFLRDKASIVGYTQGKYYRQPDRIKYFFDQSHNEGYRNPINEFGQYAEDFKAKNFTYFMHHDPAVSHCSYAIALGHKENDLIVIDMIHKFNPLIQGGEIDTEEIKTFTKEIIERFPGVELITYDTWAATDCMQMLEKKGYKRENLYVRKPQHDLLKEKIYEFRVRCHQYKSLEDELNELEVSGNDVDHPENGSKDCADAVAAVVWHCVHNEASAVTAGASMVSKDDSGNVRGLGFKGLNMGRRRRIWE